MHSHLLWRKAPVLYYSLSLLLAILFALKTPWALLLLPFLLWKQPLLKAFVTLGIFLLMVAYLQHEYYFPPSGFTGSFVFYPRSLIEAKQSFQKGIIYKGYIKKMHDEKQCYKCHLPISIRLQEHLDLEYEYKMKGMLQTKNGQYYTIEALSPLEQGKKQIFSLLKVRKQGKEWLQSYIHNHYPSGMSAAFLTALTTGMQEDQLLKAHLTQIGCAHLLAISGFHFALIATFCHLLLRPFFHYKIHYSILLLLLFCYYLFLGKSASICRALIFAFCFFLGPLLERRSSTLNALGISLAFCLLLDPPMALELGFQLSFLATGAILTLYPPLRKLLIHKNSGLCRRFFEETMALNLAVHAALLPLLLLYFHSISLHSIIYNLFFPSLTAISLMTFLSGFLLQIVCPPVGHCLHLLNNRFTEMFVSLAEKRWIYEKSFFVESFPSWAVALFFILLYLAILKLTKEND